jgi:hypothetical protein
MTDEFDFEARLADRLRAHAAAASRAFDALAIAHQAVEAGARHPMTGRLEWPPRRLTVGWSIVGLLLAMAALGAIAGIGALVRDAEPGPLDWQPQRYAQDWPAPVRAESPSGDVVVPMILGDEARWDPSEGRWGPFRYGDAIGDTGRDEFPWLDIEKVHLDSDYGTASFGIVLAGEIPSPVPSPAMTWIAYGLALDTDDDGVADVRVGIDNMPSGEHRAWWTDLASGETRWSAGPPYGWVGEPEGGSGAGRIGLDTWYPGEEGSGRATFRYSAREEERPLRFYVWVSMIERGRVAATDYAPDVGWLEEGTQPELTLVGPVWEMGSESGSLTIVQTLAFTEDGKVSIDAGCRTGVANVTVEQGTLRIGPPVLTENGSGCSAQVRERSIALLDSLTEARLAFTIDDGILELRSGSEVLRFTATFAGPPTGG